MKECANAPNNKQTAIAQSAIEVLQKYPQQVLVVKGGQGKSRIAAMIAFIAVETGVAERVHMVYTNRILKEKDQDDFKQLWSISEHVDAVAYHEDIEFSIGNGELVIFDEADEYIYGSTQQFLDFVKEHRAICMTATRGGTAQDHSEKMILQHIGLQIFDSDTQGKLDFRHITFLAYRTIHGSRA